MNNLKIYGKEANSIFRLIGKDENALTYAFGYVLSERRDLLIDFLKEVSFIKKKRGKNYDLEFENYSIHLQKYNDDKTGIKDIVIEDNKSKNFKVIIEAKTDNSLPSENQIKKYTKKEINTDLDDFQNKAIILLTRKILPADTFSEMRKELAQNKIKLLIVSWSQVYKLIYNYRHISSNFYKDRIVFELNSFLMKDYQIKYFEYEVLYRKVLKDYYFNICNCGDKGFYFDGGRKKFIYPSCLFFLACYGPARSSKKTGEYLRRIDDYYISSSKEILNSDNNPLVEAFKRHLDKFGGDSNVDRIHVFELGDKIRIPKSNTNFNGSEKGYKMITQILNE